MLQARLRACWKRITKTRNSKKLNFGAFWPKSPILGVRAQNHISGQKMAKNNVTGAIESLLGAY